MGQTADLPLELFFKRLLNEKRNQISNNEAGQIPDKGGFPFVEQGYAPLFKHLEPLLMLLGFLGHIFKYLTHGYGHLLKGFKPLGLGGYVSYIPGAAFVEFASSFSAKILGYNSIFHIICPHRYR